HRRVDAGAAERHLFLDQAVVEAAAAEPAVRLGDLDVHEPGVPGLLQDLLGELAGLVEVSRLGDDLLAREVTRGLGEGLLLFGEAQIHAVRVPRTASPPPRAFGARLYGSALRAGAT